MVPNRLFLLVQLIKMGEWNENQLLSVNKTSLVAEEDYILLFDKDENFPKRVDDFLKPVQDLRDRVSEIENGGSFSGSSTPLGIYGLYKHVVLYDILDVNYNEILQQYKIELINNTKIKILESGIYHGTCSVNVEQTLNPNTWIWIEKNGIPIGNGVKLGSPADGFYHFEFNTTLFLKEKDILVLRVAKGMTGNTIFSQASFAINQNEENRIKQYAILLTLRKVGNLLE